MNLWIAKLSLVYFVSITCSTICYGQSEPFHEKDGDTTVTTIYLSVCLREDPFRSDISGVVRIRQIINGNVFEAYIDTNLGSGDVIPACKTGRLPKGIGHNIIKINDELIKLDVFDYFIPDKLISFRMKDYQYVVLSMYSFDYISLIGHKPFDEYVVMKLDKEGKLLEYCDFESEISLSDSGILKQLERRLTEKRP